MSILLKIVAVIIGIISVIIPFAEIYNIFTHSFHISSLIVYLIFGGIFYIIYRSSLTEEKKQTITRGHLIIAVIWFFPIGLYLLWKNSKNKITNTIVTAIIAFLLIFGFASYTPKVKEDKSVDSTSVSDEITTTLKETPTTVTTITTTAATTSTTTETTATTTTTVAVTTTEPITEPPTEAPYVPPVQSNQHNYVLNTNTMVFHYSGCTSAKKIKEENRSDTYATREEVLSWGYSPCGNCNP